jgi:SIR2-like domain
MILVFAGAGASKAVSPENYPTTIEFFERLPDAIRENKTFDLVHSHLLETRASDAIDIEHVLWALGDLERFTERATDTTSFPGWIIDSNRINTLMPEHYDFGPARRGLVSATNAAKRLASEINRLVYQYYRRAPSKKELNNTWLTLLQNLGTQRTEVFTTNYDLIIEHALHLIGSYKSIGRTEGITTELNREAWDITVPATMDRDYGLLTKLHGSIDWIRGDDGEIFVGTPQFTGQHQQHAIIYPGFKGHPEAEPFTLFHDYFRYVVQHASAAIFIGFAFRDEYINEILRERMRPEIPIVIIGWGPESPSIPFNSDRYQYFSIGFTRETSMLAVEYIEDRIGTLSPK